LLGDAGQKFILLPAFSSIVWVKKIVRNTAGLVQHFEDISIYYKTSSLILWEMMLKIMLVDDTNVEEGRSKLRGLQDFPQFSI